MSINTKEFVEAVQSVRASKEEEYHKHQDGGMGSSHIPSCDILFAFNQLGVKLPGVHSLRKGLKILQLGHLLHEHTQSNVQDFFHKHQTEMPNVYFAPEVMVILEIVKGKGDSLLDGYGKPLIDERGQQLYANGLFIESPIDNAYSDQPFVSSKWRFQNIVAGEGENSPLYRKSTKGNWLQIEDIKSAGVYSWAHMYHGDLSLTYLCQFHFYMAATGMQKLWLYGIDKLTGEVLYKAVEFQPIIWDFAVKILQQKYELKRSIAAKFQMMPKFQKALETVLDAGLDVGYNSFTSLLDALETIQPENLCFFRNFELDLVDDISSEYKKNFNQNIDWMGCPLCQIEFYEAKNKPGHFSQRLIKPCYWAEKFMKIQAVDRFTKGSCWKRLKIDKDWGYYEEVSVIGWKEEEISVGKINTESEDLVEDYLDNVVYAWINYKEILN
ncbi:MAG: hypothetical protein ACTSRK_01285 [Promethearchaeota archaeon]